MSTKQNIQMETKLKWLNWVVDFCNLDMKSVGRLKKLELYFAVRDFLFPVRFEAWVDDYERWLPKLKSFDLPSIVWDPVPLIQDDMRWLLDKLVEMAEKIYSKEASVSTLPLPDLDLKPVIQMNYSSDLINLMHIESKLLAVYKDEKKVNRYLSTGFKARRSITPPLPSDYYIYSLGKLLDGVPSKWIRKCKGCSRFFLNPTEREKIFCTPSCASRSIAKMKREELKKDPKKYQAYLEKQKKYMKKRYREMRKASLGPAVKVGRKEG